VDASRRPRVGVLSFAIRLVFRGPLSVGIE